MPHDGAICLVKYFTIILLLNKISGITMSNTQGGEGIAVNPPSTAPYMPEGGYNGGIH